MSPQQRAGIAGLYAQHHAWLQLWLRRRLDDRALAAELTQETFVRLMAGRAVFSIRQPRHYLATIARGLLIDHYRRRRRERTWREYMAIHPASPVPPPEVRLLAQQDLQHVQACLQSLRPTVREAFVLARLEGLAYREIAARLGISLRTVNQHIHTARQHCRPPDR